MSTPQQAEGTQQGASIQLATSVLIVEDHSNELLSNLTSVHEAIGLLERLKFPVKLVKETLEDRLEGIRRQPTPEDMRWPLDVPEAIGDHISLGNDRPTLSCRAQAGRMYSLTPGQRDVVREWFGLTPTQLVEVERVELYPNSQYIKSVGLRSTGLEHTVNQATKTLRSRPGSGLEKLPTRSHMLVKFTIDTWGKFCDLAKQRDGEREEARLALSEDVLQAEGTSTKPAKVSKKSAASTKSFQQLTEEYAV